MSGGEIDFENGLDKRPARGRRSQCSRIRGEKGRGGEACNAQECGSSTPLVIMRKPVTSFPVKQIQLDRKYQKISRARTRDAFTNAGKRRGGGGGGFEIRRRNIHASPAPPVNFIKGVIP